MKKGTDLKVTMASLTPENRRILRRMARYLDSYSLNQVAYEELMNDLAGMALECQERQQSFSEAVGMDEVAFCQELVANCPRETVGERLIGLLLWILAWGAAVVPAMAVLEWIFPWMSGEMNGAIYTVPVPYLSKYCVSALLIAVGIYFLKRNIYRSKYAVGVAYGAVFLLVFITVSEVTSRMVNGLTVDISLVVWLLVFAVLILLCYVAKRCVAMTVAYQQKRRQLREDRNEKTT